ncbi:unnamed protein product [Miscanthus lutarioriparius]|uniref:Uncharacterized protein n=1 Tax=Miscanthus lutarioriparius TaxID=422564 RepID=A0A811PPN4_9POAL|nr:unnamed protein product [Miscanthus lutarioriparius]
MDQKSNAKRLTGVGRSTGCLPFLQAVVWTVDLGVAHPSMKRSRRTSGRNRLRRLPRPRLSASKIASAAVVAEVRDLGVAVSGEDESRRCSEVEGAGLLAVADLQRVLGGVGAGQGRGEVLVQARMMVARRRRHLHVSLARRRKWAEGTGVGCLLQKPAVATAPSLAGPAPKVGRRRWRGLSSRKPARHQVREP